MSTYPTDATYIVGGTTYDITNRKPDRGYATTQDFAVAQFESQIPGYNTRRLLSRRGTRIFNISYTNILGGYKSAIEDFYQARFGTHESFDFDLTHINQTGTVRVRFQEGLTITGVLSTDSDETSIYSVSFRLVESYT